MNDAQKMVLTAGIGIICFALAGVLWIMDNNLENMCPVRCTELGYENSTVASLECHCYNSTSLAIHPETLKGWEQYTIEPVE